jgi:hypothetical protein
MFYILSETGHINDINEERSIYKPELINKAHQYKVAH